MAIHKTEAIVIDRKDYRETSYLLSFFTADFGKIHAQAKGAKRKIDKFGSNFVPISYNNIVFYESIQGSLNIISQADLLEHFSGIDKDIEKYTYASYFLELINATMGLGDKNKEIFVLLKNFLNFIDKEDKIPHIVQIFEIKFLNLSGLSHVLIVACIVMVKYLIRAGLAMSWEVFCAKNALVLRKMRKN